MALPFLRILLITARKRVLYTNEPFRLLQEVRKNRMNLKLSTPLLRGWLQVWG